MGQRELEFMVIGAQKAGTTSLFEYLRRHPELSLPPAKEAPYFSHDANYRQDRSEYLGRIFPNDGLGRKRGTVTPHYMVGSVYGATPDGPEYDETTVPLRIRERLPELKLIAVLRDPVQRAFSHHRMAVLMGVEHRPFQTAVGDLLSPAALEDSRRYPQNTSGYITWGEYGRILGGYRDVFAAEQLLVLFTDDLERTPELVLRRVFDFLGVAPDFVPDNLGVRYRQGGSARRVSWLDLHSLRRASKEQKLVRALWARLPQPTRHRLSAGADVITYRTDLWNRRSALQTSDETPDPETAAQLGAHFESDHEQLAKLLRAHPPWMRGSATADATS